MIHKEDNSISNYELIFNYITAYKDWYEDMQSEINNTDDWGNKRNPKTELFAYTSALWGYNGFPKIVKTIDFNKINKQELYHGLQNHAFGANYLWDPVFHVGEGNYGSGMYFSTDFDDARSFVGGFYKDDTKIITAKLNCDSSKIVKYSTLVNICEFLLGKPNEFNLSMICEDMNQRLVELIEFLNSIDSPENYIKVERFKMLLKDNPSVLGVILGADAVHNTSRPEFFTGKHIIVLNREKLIIPEKCAKTIFKKGGIDYKDINYVLTNVDELIGNETQSR